MSGKGPKKRSTNILANKPSNVAFFGAIASSLGPLPNLQHFNSFQLFYFFAFFFGVSWDRRSSESWGGMPRGEMGVSAEIYVLGR